VSHEFITTEKALQKFCGDLSGASTIAFDTEFVSEHSYRPQLCLIQVAAEGHLAVIDPLAVGDVRPFWELLASAGHETLVHAGREELLFSMVAIGRPPARLFDVQIAAGLVGHEYPAGYGSLLYKLIGKRLEKGETRTDWRRRPLSSAQIEYALDDVRYLAEMAAKLQARLKELKRTAWIEFEMAAWMAGVEATRTTERWWKVSGATGLSRRSKAVLREIWRWREAEAQRRDCSARRVLRDDLIVELAKRRSADPAHIRSLRGMERGDLQRSVPQLSAAVKRAIDLPDDECPAAMPRDTSPQLTVLGQFLTSALASICRSADLAPSIVGTASDVRDLVAYRLDQADGNGRQEPPALGQGWRAEVVGRLIEDLLSGTLAVRVADPRADDPLTFERLG
jgi:ribonuclease D